MCAAEGAPRCRGHRSRPHCIRGLTHVEIEASQRLLIDAEIFLPRAVSSTAPSCALTTLRDLVARPDGRADPVRDVRTRDTRSTDLVRAA
jgi:hypothetical protein